MKTKIGIIGLGGIAKYAHIPAVSQDKTLEVVGICDINEEKFAPAEELLGYKAKHYADYRELLKDESIEAVHVCTPNYLHAEISSAALGAGKHVLCEKPDAMTFEEVLAMKAAQDRSGKRLMVMRNNRFLNASVFLRDLIDSGETGELYTGRCGWVRRRGIPGKGGWFTTKAQSGGGPLIDLGVHMIDLAMYFMGNPKPVAVSGTTFCKFAENDVSDSVHASFGEKTENGTFDVEDLAIGFIRFEDGRSLQIEFSWASNVEAEKNFVELRGEKMGFSLENEKLKVFGERAGLLTDLCPQAGVSRGHADYIAHFYRVIREGERPIYTIDQGADMIRILNAIYESAETGREVRL